MNYTKIFNPQLVQVSPELGAEVDSSAPDRRDGRVYVYDEQIVLAVNVALATGRPLLVRGPSGCGKSSLARSIARSLEWRYYETVISSRTQARDLLWHFDALRRLNDAQAQQIQTNTATYIEPGVLWWAFDRESARRRGTTSDDAAFQSAEPEQETDSARAVILLDEIDKADPDLPNDLLVPLGSLEFTVLETNTRVTCAPTARPLMIITTNDERELSTAFLRRCATLILEPPNQKRLVEIAKAHFGDKREAFYLRVAEVVSQTASVYHTKPLQLSAAEYLDTVLACIQLNIDPAQGDPTWEAVLKTTLWKPNAPEQVLNHDL